MKDLPGGTVIWVFAAVELLTFTLFFGAYATSAAAEPAIYAAAAALVHPRAAALNTGVLLIASWAAARAVGSSWRWWLGVAALGLVQAERDEPLVYVILGVAVLKAWLVQGAFMRLDRSPRLWGALASLTALVAVGVALLFSGATS